MANYTKKTVSPSTPEAVDAFLENIAIEEAPKAPAKRGRPKAVAVEEVVAEPVESAKDSDNVLAHYEDGHKAFTSRSLAEEHRRSGFCVRIEELE